MFSVITPDCLDSTAESPERVGTSQIDGGVQPVGRMFSTSKDAHQCFTGYDLQADMPRSDSLNRTRHIPVHNLEVVGWEPIGDLCENSHAELSGGHMGVVYLQSLIWQGRVVL
jgi:hypothetical protein